MSAIFQVEQWTKCIYRRFSMSRKHSDLSHIPSGLHTLHPEKTHYGARVDFRQCDNFARADASGKASDANDRVVQVRKTPRQGVGPLAVYQLSSSSSSLSATYNSHARNVVPRTNTRFGDRSFSNSGPKNFAKYGTVCTQT